MEPSSPDKTPTIPVRRFHTKLYSVPRRFDLATIMIVTSAFALLFGVIRLFDFGLLGFAAVAGFFTCVALAQAIMFGGRAPRAASIVAGGSYCALFALSADPAGLCIGVVYGGILGYLAGILIASVFLVTDLARMLVRRRRGQG